jgi:hypothetical protein
MIRLLAAAAAALAVAWTLAPARVLSHERVNTTVTYDREIVRIVSRKCLACHSDGNLGPPLTTYEQTRPWARAIEEEVLRRHMPPWRAVAGYGEFANDVSLTNKELQFIVAWVEGNGPKTKEQRLIVNVDQGHTPESERLTLDAAKWTLGTPDLLRRADPTAVDPGEPLQIRRVTIDLGLSQDRWVRALEFKPGDRRVVRAASFSIEDTGQWLGTWTPWHGTITLPEHVAYQVKAGARVVAEMHYRGAGEPVTEQGTLGVYFAAAPPVTVPSNLVVETRLTLPRDVTVLALNPEIGAGTRAIEVTARAPGGRTAVLLLVKNVLPEWPTPYIFKQPVTLTAGTELRASSPVVASVLR